MFFQFRQELNSSKYVKLLIVMGYVRPHILHLNSVIKRLCLWFYPQFLKSNFGCVLYFEFQFPYHWNFDYYYAYRILNSCSWFVSHEPYFFIKVGFIKVLHEFFLLHWVQIWKVSPWVYFLNACFEKGFKRTWMASYVLFGNRERKEYNWLSKIFSFFLFGGFWFRHFF